MQECINNKDGFEFTSIVTCHSTAKLGGYVGETRYEKIDELKKSIYDEKLAEHGL